MQNMLLRAYTTKVNFKIFCNVIFLAYEVFARFCITSTSQDCFFLKYVGICLYDIKYFPSVCNDMILYAYTTEMHFKVFCVHINVINTVLYIHCFCKLLRLCSSIVRLY